MDIKDRIRSLGKQHNLRITKALTVQKEGVVIKRCETIEELYQFLEGYNKPVPMDEDLPFNWSLVSKHKPFLHQKQCFMQSKDERAYAYLMEMGTGKTLTTLMVASYLFQQKEIDSIVVIAPNGVHRDWTKACSEHLPIPFKAGAYSSSMNKGDTRYFETLYKPGTDLRIVSFNVEGFSSKKATQLCEKFLSENQCLMVVDESARIKNPKSARTKNILRLGQYAKYKRILTGTPVTQGAIDLYSQYWFLDPKIIGIDSFLAYKARYVKEDNFLLKNQLMQFVGKDLGNMLYDLKKIKGKVVYSDITGQGIDPGRASQIFKLMIKTPMFVNGSKNMEELHNKIYTKSFRVLKKDCLDLPEKLYQIRTVSLSKEKMKLYKQLKDDLVVEIGEEEMSVNSVLLRMLRLQQLIGGHYVDDKTGDVKPLPGTNEKLEAIFEIIDDLAEDTKVIIWCRFVAEIRLLEKEFRNRYGEESFGLIYGDVSNVDRDENIRRLQEDKECRFIIGNQAAGGIGRNMTAATYAIYYSNEYSYAERCQSEDRCHRIGTKSNVTIIDLVAEKTIDEKVVNALQNKKNVADTITGDKRRFFD